MTLARRLPRFVTPLALCSALTMGVILLAGSAPVAQTASPTQASPSATTVSFDILIAEVRQLRAAVEESTRRQTHIQMLSVSLTARQSRLVETANRLEATRRELTGAIARTQASEGVMKMFQRDTTTPASPPVTPEGGGAGDLFKAQLEAARQHEEALRAREAELLNALQIEQAQWTDLVARLEQSVAQ